MSDYPDASIIVKWSRKNEEDHKKSMIILEKIQTMKVDEVISLVKDIEIDLTLYANDAIHIASAIENHCSIV
jgi:predicted nucleic acid-binding protein